MISFLLKALGWLGSWILVIVAGFLLWAWIVEYKPDATENITIVGSSERLVGDTIKIVSWNIGYAGLGSDMDFFMDGGRSTQTSYGRTMENLRAIVAFLELHRDADFILLQEVDFDAKRSYHINQYDTIIKHLGVDFRGFSALNFVASYVPIPLSNPIGSVRAGVVTLSRYRPSTATRYQYPGGFSWPSRMFNLKRCMLALEVPLSDSASLYIGNTHNSAYDDGEMRTGEMMFMSEYMQGKKYAVIGGDWNSTPPGYKSSPAELSDQHFSPRAVVGASFPAGSHFLYDETTRSARYGYEPYDVATTTTTTIDFAVSSERVEPLSVECVDLGFENSDHNPMIYKYLIRK